MKKCKEAKKMPDKHENQQKRRPTKSGSPKKGAQPTILQEKTPIQKNKT